MGIVKRAIALCAVLCAAVFAQPQWLNLYPSYTGLAFGEDRFVAVGSDGVIKILNSDGSLRLQHFPMVGGTRNLYSVAYGVANDIGTFVVTQNISSLLSSVDGGQSWSNPGTLANADCRRLMFGRDRFIGLGDAGKTYVYNYDDLLEEWLWSQRSTSSNLYHVAAGENVFVAVGAGIMSTGDGMGWVSRHSGYSGELNLVAYGAGKFVAFSSAAGGTVFTSANGTEGWTSAAAAGLPAQMADFTFGGGKFVAVGAAGVSAASENGTDWTTSVMNPSDNFIAVKYGDGTFMALGAAGSVYTSADGVNWSRKADGRMMSYKQIAYGGGKFVAVGDSGASVSDNGKDWSRISAGDRFKGLQGIAYGNGKFMAVGDAGAVFISENGSVWTDESRSNSISFTGVAYGNKMFMAVGRSGASSASVAILADDGTGWTEPILNAFWSTGTYPSSVCFADSLFFAGGNNTGILKSTKDGKSAWNAVPADGLTGYRIESITNTDGRIIALGVSPDMSNTILTSTNVGSSWTKVTPPSIAIKAVTYAKGFYVAVSDTGRILASNNGQEWVAQSRTINKNLLTIYSAENILLAGGAGGALLYSDATPVMVSVRHTQTPRSAARGMARMSLERTGKTLAVNLPFTSEKQGVITIYSLTGKLLYRGNVGAGEKTARLPAKAIPSNGSVIVRYAGGNGRTAAQRFQLVK